MGHLWRCGCGACARVEETSWGTRDQLALTITRYCFCFTLRRMCTSCARINDIICQHHRCLGTPLSPFIAHTIAHYFVFPRPPFIAIHTIQYWWRQYRVNAKGPRAREARGRGRAMRVRTRYRMSVCFLCGSRPLCGSLPLCVGRPLCGRPLCGLVPCGSPPSCVWSSSRRHPLAGWLTLLRSLPRLAPLVSLRARRSPGPTPTAHTRPSSIAEHGNRRERPGASCGTPRSAQRTATCQRTRGARRVVSLSLSQSVSVVSSGSGTAHRAVVVVQVTSVQVAGV